MYKRVKPETEEKMLEPVGEGEMLNSRYKGHYSICQKLREIYQKTNDPEIKMVCRICVSMAKSMQNKLKYYRNLMPEAAEKERFQGGEK